MHEAKWNKMRNSTSWLLGLGLWTIVAMAGCASPGRATEIVQTTGEPLPIPSPHTLAYPDPRLAGSTAAAGPATSTIAATSAPVPQPLSTAPLVDSEPPRETSTFATPVSSAEPTPTVWPTVTRQILAPDVAAGLDTCDRRVVGDDWLIVVTQQFGLPESYIPPDLVALSDYFSTGVTVGIPSSVRAGLIEPLRQIIDDMHAAGLAPSILSGYRSYGEQYLAWKWWNSQYPERVAIMSARAGHSEHQLGTTVDFGSPALNHLFHVDFAGTPEGLWLAENAHRYGFTMSYPADTYDVTGFKYEPWHFRYVGVELASELDATGQILTEWQLDNLPPPCIP